MFQVLFYSSLLFGAPAAIPIFTSLLGSSLNPQTSSSQSNTPPPVATPVNFIPSANSPAVTLPTQTPLPNPLSNLPAAQIAQNIPVQHQIIPYSDIQNLPKEILEKEKSDLIKEKEETKLKVEELKAAEKEVDEEIFKKCKRRIKN